jgi:hypothetical protein
MSNAPTPPISPAEEICIAAARAHAIAEAATKGPWWSDDSDNAWRLHGVAFTVPPQLGGEIPAQPVNKQILKAPKHGTSYAEYWPDPADDAHITMWHPGVTALAAAFLEAEGDRASEALYPDGQEWRCRHCGWAVDTGNCRCTCWDATLTLARAINEKAG